MKQVFIHAITGLSKRAHYMTYRSKVTEFQFDYLYPSTQLYDLYGWRLGFTDSQRAGILKLWRLARTLYYSMLSCWVELAYTVYFGSLRLLGHVIMQTPCFTGHTSQNNNLIISNSTHSYDLCRYRLWLANSQQANSVWGYAVLFLAPVILWNVLPG